jgi:hypothetical protein
MYRVFYFFYLLEKYNISLLENNIRIVQQYYYICVLLRAKHFSNKMLKTKQNLNKAFLSLQCKKYFVLTTGYIKKQIIFRRVLYLFLNAISFHP